MILTRTIYSFKFTSEVCMRRVVIDTNILYSLTGVSVNEKVVTSSLNDFKLSITTPSIIEMVVKFQYDLDTIKKCLEPIINESIELISIGHAPISNEYLYMLHFAKEIEEVADLIDEIKTLKISREAEFYRFILILVVSGLFEVIREDGYKFCDETRNQKQLMMVRSLFESNMDLILDYFKDEIRNGYMNGNEQQAALDAFQSKIIMLLNVFHINYHMIKTDTFPYNESSVNLENLIISLDSDNFNIKLKKYIDNPLSFASKAKYNTIINNYMAEMRNGMLDLSGLTEKSMDFLLNKIDSAYKNGRKLRKNDIFDFLIVISLNMPDTLIVTLDKGFLKDLEHLDYNSYQLCQKLGYIK